MAWIVLPQEYAGTICDVLADAGCDVGGRYDQEALAWGNVAQGVPSYADALTALDEWHAANIWSNSPVAIHVPNVQQRSVIRLFLPGTDGHERIIKDMRITTADDSLAAFYENMLRNGAPSQYAQTMQAMRDNFRLDRL